MCKNLQTCYLGEVNKAAGKGFVKFLWDKFADDLLAGPVHHIVFIEFADLVFMIMYKFNYCYSCWHWRQDIEMNSGVDWLDERRCTIHGINGRLCCKD